MDQLRRSDYRIVMKKTATICLLFFILVSCCVASLQNPVNISSHGEIQFSLTVILRGSQVYGEVDPRNISGWVDKFVQDHNFGSDIYIQFGARPDQIIWYPYTFNSSAGTLKGFTWAQWKELIDRFHYHGWKIGLNLLCWWMPTGSTSAFWEWCNNYHRELAYVNANGKKIRLSGTDSYGYGDTVHFVADWFKNFTTDDPAKGIKSGERLIDVFCERLTQMIRDGLDIDYVYFSDGWYFFGGITGIYLWSKSNPDYNSWGPFSDQEINEWGNNTYGYADTEHQPLPPDWASYSFSQKVNWIRDNAKDNYASYWAMRQAQVFAKIRQALIDAGKTQEIKTICMADWNMGYETEQRNGLNFTLFERLHSFDYYAIAQEGVGGAGSLRYPEADCRNYAELQKEHAMISGMIKAKAPSAKVLTSLSLSWGFTGAHNQLWCAKQEYLAQVCNYAWHNGTRYRTCKPDKIFVQYWHSFNKTAANLLFDWINSILPYLEYVTPIYLGPTYIMKSNHYWVSNDVNCLGFNFTINQWIDFKNLELNNQSFIKSEMGTLLIDARQIANGGWAVGKDLIYYGDKILSSFSNGNLSIIFLDTGALPHEIFGDQIKCESTFRYKTSSGSSNFATVLDVTKDSYGRWIVGGHVGDAFEIVSVNAWQYGSVEGREGAITLAKFDDERLESYIYYNPTSARYIYFRYPFPNGHWTGKATGFYTPVTLARQVINRGIYWASYCPINSSEPLIDIKIFRLPDGRITISLMNMRDHCPPDGNKDLGTPISATFKIDSERLGLGSFENYKIFMVSNNSQVAGRSWDNITLTLNGMADILVIEQI